MEQKNVTSNKFDYGKEYFSYGYSDYYSQSVKEKYKEDSDALKTERIIKKKNTRILAYIAASAGMITVMLVGIFNGVSVKENSITATSTTIEFDLKITNTHSKTIYLILTNDSYREEKLIKSKEFSGSFTDLSPETEYKLSVIEKKNKNEIELYYKMITTTK